MGGEELRSRIFSPAPQTRPAIIVVWLADSGPGQHAHWLISDLDRWILGYHWSEAASRALIGRNVWKIISVVSFCPFTKCFRKDWVEGNIGWSGGRREDTGRWACPKKGSRYTSEGVNFSNPQIWTLLFIIKKVIGNL